MIYPRTSKKLIKFGWDKPLPAYVRDHLALMEQRPFDGFVIRLPAEAGGGEVFDPQRWRQSTVAAREHELAILANLPRSTVFRHNFVVLYGASTMDWFSDADWAIVLEHTRYCAEAAKAAECVGICWDPESYHDLNPWNFPQLPSRNTHSYAEHAHIVRQRGVEFVQALQEVMPGLTIFALRLLSDFADGSPFAQHLFGLRDPELLQAQIANSFWGLHAAFINGMLAGANPDVTLIDGNEDAYYYTSALEFYHSVQSIRDDGLLLVEPELRGKFRAQYRIGHAVAVDYTSGNWSDLPTFPAYLSQQALELSPAQQIEWFEHNCYYALASSDEYLWCYSEDQNWWTGEGVPPGYEAALRSARQKYETGQPLVSQIAEVLATARVRIKARVSQE
jgi:hypothetical protein